MAEFVFNQAQPRESIQRLRVLNAAIGQYNVVVSVEVVAGSSDVVRHDGYNLGGDVVPPTTAATIAFLTALATARAGESGGVLARANYRILGHLADLGLLTGGTVVAG